MLEGLLNKTETANKATADVGEPPGKSEGA
jgi:hypothetical protein